MERDNQNSDLHVKNWADFLLVNKGRSPVGVKRYRENVDRFLNWLREVKQKTAFEAKRVDVDEFMRELFFSMGNLKNSSRASKLSAIRSFYKYLVYLGALAVDPTKGIPTPRVSKPLPTKFTTEELQLIFSAPDPRTHRGLRDLAILKTIYGAGLRVSELNGLDLADLSESGTFFRLHIHGKGEKERIVTLRKNPSETLKKWLAVRATYQLDTEAVFIRFKHKIHSRLSTQSVQKILKTYAKKVGINKVDVFCHKLRATFATDLYDVSKDRCGRCGARIEKYDILEIMAILGHNDPKTTMRYIAISEKVTQRTAIPDRRWKELSIEPRGEQGDI